MSDGSKSNSSLFQRMKRLHRLQREIGKLRLQTTQILQRRSSAGRVPATGALVDTPEAQRKAKKQNRRKARRERRRRRLREKEELKHARQDLKMCKERLRRERDRAKSFRSGRRRIKEMNAKHLAELDPIVSALFSVRDDLEAKLATIRRKRVASLLGIFDVQPAAKHGDDGAFVNSNHADDFPSASTHSGSTLVGGSIRGVPFYFSAFRRAQRQRLQRHRLRLKREHEESEERHNPFYSISPSEEARREKLAREEREAEAEIIGMSDKSAARNFGASFGYVVCLQRALANCLGVHLPFAVSFCGSSSSVGPSRCSVTIAGISQAGAQAGETQAADINASSRRHSKKPSESGPRPEQVVSGELRVRRMRGLRFPPPESLDATHFDQSMAGRYTYYPVAAAAAAAVVGGVTGGARAAAFAGAKATMTLHRLMVGPPVASRSSMPERNQDQRGDMLRGSKVRRTDTKVKTRSITNVPTDDEKERYNILGTRDKPLPLTLPHPESPAEKILEEAVWMLLQNSRWLAMMQGVSPRVVENASILECLRACANSSLLGLARQRVLVPACVAADLSSRDVVEPKGSPTTVPSFELLRDRLFSIRNAKGAHRLSHADSSEDEDGWSML
jgi:hypothetical protein